MANINEDERDEESRDDGFKLTDAVGRTLRALTDAATEAAISSLRVAGDIAINVAENLANNLADAVVAPANIAQKVIDRFRSTLSTDEEDEHEEDRKVRGQVEAEVVTRKARPRPPTPKPPSWARPASARVERSKTGASEEEPRAFSESGSVPYSPEKP